MRKIRLGRTEALVGAISVGTWAHGGPSTEGDLSVGWSGQDDDAARAALLEAHRAGMNHWDTADAYGNGHSERIIGSMWGEVPRERVFLASKVGWRKGPHERFYEPSWMRSQLEASLRNLKTDVIDLHYLHHCHFGPEGAWFDDAIGMMRRFREEGLIRFIGLSDWSCAKILQFLERADPDVIQPYRNVVDDDWESSGLRAAAHQRDLGVAFFSPLRHGLLLGKYNTTIEFPPGDHRERVAGFRDEQVIRTMKHAADAARARFASHPEPVLHALTGALLTGEPTACVLLGQRSAAHARAAATLGDALSPEDAAWVRGVYLGRV